MVTQIDIVQNSPVVENTDKAITNEESIWHILLNTNEKMFYRGISIVNILRELAALGEYNISRFEQGDNKVDAWSIFLRTAASKEAIEEVFMFIEDDCIINKLSEKMDIGNVEKHQKTSKKKINFIEFAENIVRKNNENKVTEVSENKKAEQSSNAKIVKRISVDSAKLDHLMYLVSELITVNSQLLVSTRSDEYGKIRSQLEKVDNLSKQFRNNALDIRLVPLSETVLRFQRLIHDLSKKLKKEIEFVTSGIDTELDKSTIDELYEPLMHIIRNSLDHGIELPEKRLAAGKASKGKITLSAYHSGSNVFIKIEDDGCGIDIEKVRLKAVSMNIIGPDDHPTRKEIYDFIFLPGFSTAQSLTEISGRGVGMDVVKKRVNDLRGEIIVESSEGHGTSFTLKLQQSLSIIDTLLFTISGNYFIVPISDIEICLQENLSEIQKRYQTSTIPFNNQLIPFVDLRALLGIEGIYPEKVKLIIVKNAERRAALLSDQIVGEHQAVLKSLGKILNKQPYIIAASQLGDGNNALMLDTPNLCNSISY